MSQVCFNYGAQNCRLGTVKIEGPLQGPKRTHSVYTLTFPLARGTEELQRDVLLQKKKTKNNWTI